MEALSSLLGGFAVVLSPLNLALMFTGIVLGVIQWVAHARTWPSTRSAMNPPTIAAAHG